MKEPQIFLQFIFKNLSDVLSLLQLLNYFQRLSVTYIKQSTFIARNIFGR